MIKLCLDVSYVMRANQLSMLTVTYMQTFGVLGQCNIILLYDKKGTF